MKKFFISAIAVAVMAAFAIPAMAVDLSGQVKVKGEWRKNGLFLDDNFNAGGIVDGDDDTAAIKQRTRLTATANPTDSTTVKVTIQDTRAWGTDNNSTDSGMNNLDTHEAYIQEDNVFGSDVALRIGRQVLSFDDQRLVGGFEWDMNARSFDAISALYSSDDFDATVFTSKIVEGGAPTANESDFHGVHATIKTIPNNSISVYALIQKQQSVLSTETVGALPATTGLLTRYTFGARLKGAVAGVDYTLEVPFQTGTMGDDEDTDISAYAVAARAGYTIGGANNIRIGGEIDYATGDDDSTDAEDNTFNNLFPTNHAHYGSMDYQAWRNMTAYNVNVSANATPDVKIIGSYWIFKRNEVMDDSYGNGANDVGVLAGANADDETGSELDITAIYKYNKALTIKGGYSHFFVGGANDEAQKAIPVVGVNYSAEDADWAWLMAVASF